MRQTAVIGIGNPGTEYEGTFHNAGLLFAAWLGERHGAAWKSRGKARYAVLHDLGGLVLGATADTFMNESGHAVAGLADYLKVRDARIVIAHDETDLPLGEVLLKEGGGTGGHRGVASVYALLPDAEIWRLKIGARPERFAGPPHVKAESFVLNRIGADELPLLKEQAFPEAERLLMELLAR